MEDGRVVDERSSGREYGHNYATIFGQDGAIKWAWSITLTFQRMSGAKKIMPKPHRILTHEYLQPRYVVKNEKGDPIRYGNQPWTKYFEDIDDIKESPTVHYKTPKQKLEEMPRPMSIMVNKLKQFLDVTNEKKKHFPELLVFYHKQEAGRQHCAESGHMHILFLDSERPWAYAPFKALIKPAKFAGLKIRTQQIYDFDRYLAYFKGNEYIFMGCSTEELLIEYNLANPKDRGETKVDPYMEVVNPGDETMTVELTDESRQAGSGLMFQWGKIEDSDSDSDLEEGGSRPAKKLKREQSLDGFGLEKPGTADKQHKLLACIDELVKHFKIANLMSMVIASKTDANLFDYILKKHGFKFLTQLRSRPSFLAFLKQSIDTTDAVPARKDMMKWINAEGERQYTNEGQDLDEELEFASDYESAYNFLQWAHCGGLNPLTEAVNILKILTCWEKDKNTYVLRGPTTIGKSYRLTKTWNYISKPQLIGSISEESFRFGDCPNKALIIQDEVRFLPEDAEILKSVLRGDFVKVNVKNQQPQQVKRTPVLLCCNEDPWTDMLGQDQAALMSRMLHTVVVGPKMGGRFLAEARLPNVGMWHVLHQYLNRKQVWDLFTQQPDVIPGFPTAEREHKYARFQSPLLAKQKFLYVMDIMCDIYGVNHNLSDNEMEDGEDVVDTKAEERSQRVAEFEGM